MAKKKSAIEVDKNFKEPDDGKIKAAPLQDMVSSNLAAHITTCFSEAERHRNDEGITDKLLDSLRQYKGEYDDKTMALIEENGGNDTFRKLTMMKCDTLYAWIDDTLSPINNVFPWAIKPTPIPELPQDKKMLIAKQTMNVANEQILPLVENAIRQGAQISQEELEDYFRQFAIERRKQEEEMADDMAKDAALGMQKLMRDQQIDSNFDAAFGEFTMNFSISQTAFFKGPIFKMEKGLKWEKENGRTVARVSNIKRMTWEAPNPLDIYPSPNARNVQDGYLIERVYYSRESLASMRDLEGYSRSEIDKLLKTEPSGTPIVIDGDSDKADLEGTEDQITTKDQKYEGVQFWGSVPGWMLIEWGMKDIESDMEYDINAIKIENSVIKATINEDPLGQRPYASASFKPIPNSFWGMSLPEAMADVQNQCNSSVRALCDNLALASGPMVAYDISQIAGNENITKLYPRKVFQFDSTAANNSSIKAVDFLNVPSNASELLSVYDHFKGEADDITNIPAFASGEGTQGTGAGETASGLAMLQGNLTKSIKRMITEISDNVIKPTLERQFNWNMQHEEDESIKGDIQVTIRGPIAAMAKEQTELRRETFMRDTMNDIDMGIIGVEGRANMLRKRAEGMDLPIDDIIPSKEEMRERGQMAQVPPPEQVPVSTAQQ